MELLKAQTFGNIFGDNILKFGAAYSFRRGYDDGPIGADQLPNDRRVAELLELTAGIKHPDYDNIDFELSYNLGESFTDLSRIDIMKFGVGMKY
jgi:hypothetical protein